MKSGEEVLDCVCGLIHSKNCTETVKGYILAAVAKSCAQSGCSLTIDAEEIVRKAASSTSTELQQRALEIQALLRYIKINEYCVLKYHAVLQWSLDADSY